MSVAPKEQQTQSQSQEPQEECASGRLGIREEFSVEDIHSHFDIDSEGDLSMPAGRSHSLTTVSSASPIDARIEGKHIMDPEKED